MHVLFSVSGAHTINYSCLTANIGVDPEAMKVRDWRHKLQKTFLSHNRIPKEEVGFSVLLEGYF